MARAAAKQPAAAERPPAPVERTRVERAAQAVRAAPGQAGPAGTEVEVTR
ncbi:hypothetical protein WMF45_18515 [Sorangium sp. So ce448]